MGIHSLFRDTSSIQSNRGHTDTFGIFCQTIRGAGASYCTEAGLFVFLPFRVFVFLPFLFYRLCVFFSFFLLLFFFFLSFCVHCHVCMSHLQEGEEHLIVQGGWGCHDPNFLCNSRKVLPKVATNLQPFLAFSNKLASATIISNPRHEFCYMPQGPVKTQ